jgi:hypothetical protein
VRGIRKQTCRRPWPQAQNKGYGPRLQYSQIPLAALLVARTQEHVFRKDVHSVDAFWPESVGQGVVSVEVLFERSAENGAITVCRKGTRQDRDVAKAALQGFV